MVDKAALMSFLDESCYAASAGGGGMMGMQPVARLEIPAGGTVELKPGGYHIMLMGLARPLKEGDEIELTLSFAKAGDVKVKAKVGGVAEGAN